MNSCLTCLFYGNRSVPYKSEVPAESTCVAQSKPLRIKKTDKLSAIKTKFR